MQVECTLDCTDLERLAEFWAQALGYVAHTTVPGRYISLSPAGPGGLTISLQQVPEPKVTKNRLHLDLLVDNLEAEAARLESLGATRLTPSPLTEFGQRWIVMADPEGNEFCLAHQLSAGDQG